MIQQIPVSFLTLLNCEEVTILVNDRTVRNQCKVEEKTEKLTWQDIQQQHERPKWQLVLATQMCPQIELDNETMRLIKKQNNTTMHMMDRNRGR